jgi:ABC-2 type transport system permease protein
MPFVLLAVMVLPALVVGIVTSYVGLDSLPMSYTGYVMTLSVRRHGVSLARSRLW